MGVWKECGKRDKPFLVLPLLKTHHQRPSGQPSPDMADRIWRSFPAKPDMAEFSRQTRYGGLFPDRVAFSCRTRVSWDGLFPPNLDWDGPAGGRPIPA